MWATTFGTHNEGFVPMAGGNGVAKAKATAALGEDRAGVEALDLGKVSKDGGRAVAEDIKAHTVGVVEPVNDAGMSLASKGGRGTQPMGRHQRAVTRAGCTLGQFCSDDLGGDGVAHIVSLEGDKAE